MIKKITPQELKIGMFVCGTNRKWIDIPFFKTKFLIKDEKQLKSLLEHCDYFLIDTSKGIDVPFKTSAAEISQPENPATDVDTNNKASAKSEYDDVYSSYVSQFSSILKHVRQNASIDLNASNQLSKQIMASVINDRQSMIEASRRVMLEDELARKSVNVCILACAVGWHLGLSTAELFTLANGALIHDIGITQIPDSIILSTAPLSTEQRAIMEYHTKYGLKLIGKTTDVSREVLQIVYHHHERIDGQGYPDKLSGDKIGLLVRIVTMTSVFEALTRERLYSRSLSAESAIQFLYSSQNSLFDSRMVEEFIDVLGIYPEGCIVELSDGALAVIAETHKTNPLKPRLRLLTNSRTELLEQAVMIDLRQQQSELNIVRILPIDEPIFDFLQLLDK